MSQCNGPTCEHDSHKLEENQVKLKESIESLSGTMAEQDLVTLPEHSASTGPEFTVGATTEQPPKVRKVNRKQVRAYMKRTGMFKQRIPNTLKGIR